MTRNNHYILLARLESAGTYLIVSGSKFDALFRKETHTTGGKT